MRALIVLTLVFLATVLADTAVFQPGSSVGCDAVCVMKFPDTNYGWNEDLLFGNSPAEDANAWASFIRFTELNDAQYQGATVNTAFLYVYAYEVIGTGSYQIGPCNSAWDENTITWNTMPGVHESSPPTYPSGTGWIMYGVSGWVQNWLDGTWNNYGIAIFDNSNNAFVALRSSDYSDSDVLPKLVLDYSPAVAFEALTWGAVKAVF